MGWGWLPWNWNNEEQAAEATAKKRTASAPPGHPAPERVPGQVSAQTYALSTGKTPPRNSAPVLQSRKQDEWRTQLLNDARANPPTEEWKQQNIWEPSKGPRKPLPELNRTNQALLENLGWVAQAEPQVVDNTQFDAMLDSSKGRTLTGHQYAIGRPELELLQQGVKGKRGVTEKGSLTDRERRVGTGELKAVPMTQEAYKALTPDQKRAVDFNTLFLEAREKDLGLTDEGTRSGNYDKSIEKLFGKEGGSDRYAPNTVKLLEDSGFTAKGQDLDEYLSLDRLISMDELGGFKFSGEELKQEALAPRSNLGVKSYLDVRTSANQAIADAKLMESAGALIDNALGNPGAWDLPSAAALAYENPLQPGSVAPPGFGTAHMSPEWNFDTAPENEQKDFVYQSLYDSLLNPEQGLSFVYNEMDKGEFTDQDLQEAYNYFDMRTKKDIAIGAINPDLLSPQEARKQLGLGD